MIRAKTPPTSDFIMSAANDGDHAEETWIDRLIRLTDDCLQEQATEPYEHDKAA